eukprot:gene38991-47431_t
MTPNNSTLNVSTSLSLNELAPVSFYRVFCFTQDFDVNRMPFDIVSRFSTVVKTSGNAGIFFDKANFSSLVSIGMVQRGQVTSISSMLQDRKIGVSVNVPIINTTSLSLSVSADHTMPGCSNFPVQSEAPLLSPDALEFTQ